MEMKEALASDQTKAVQLAEKSLQAIDIVTGQANFYLAVLTFGLAVVGLLGLAAIYVGAKREARKVAESRVRAYTTGAEAKDMIRAAIADEVSAQLERRAFVVVQPPQPENNEPKFPNDPKQGGGQ
jgi:hypothetical protein